MSTINHTQIIVTHGQCDCHAVERTEVHHHDYPEMHAEGETPANAAAHLLNLFLRALDSAPSDFRREAVEHAIDDVKHFIQTLD
jgi:hypothetical protein